MAELARCAEPRLAELSPQGLSNLLWGFARLCVQPSARWMDGYARAAMARLADFKPQVCVGVRSLPVFWRVQPSARWMDAVHWMRTHGPMRASSCSSTVTE